MIRVRVDPELPSVVGFVWATGVGLTHYPDGFDARLEQARQHRTGDPDADDEAIRTSVRDMLRHGTYKPTGRGKPASEYLVRAVREASFPRINSVVDVCNLISLESLLPISLWDIEKAGVSAYRVRHGRAGESYVFNRAGQVIDVQDLIVGCRLSGSDDGVPIVNPVKDSLATKTDETSRHVAALVYAPPTTPRIRIEEVSISFARLLSECGETVETGWGIAGPGDEIET